ncbi:MAG: N-acetyl-gamma-glutamyl-phosphate reductase, partial [Candidatus Saganbacteria bacterium]|nr:N-acetyl-gamma-glutamyl-phosphate reductase [Candidatus Saganbacteria bacterium]
RSAVYGSPEIYGPKISKAKLVANPGCYATSAILAVWPLVKKGLVKEGSVIIDSASGVSGAGKNLTLATHFPECNEGYSAYKVATHRHTPEIEQELKTQVTFTPHLAPWNRGIFSTIYLKLKTQKKIEEIRKLYKGTYKDASFVRVVSALPNIKQVCGSNFCDICVQYDSHTEYVIILSVIDNLVKGAAGQAIQNMNLMFGLPETMGLLKVGMYP